MPAYVVVSVDVTNPDGFQRYVAASAGPIQAHGGEVLAADRATEVLEGPARPLTVILRFPDKAAAEEWYRSSDYQAVVNLRHESADSTLVIADGFVPPS
jgi:uncharacterized protein (DUF1330 family)